MHRVASVLIVMAMLTAEFPTAIGAQQPADTAAQAPAKTADETAFEKAYGLRKDPQALVAALVDFVNAYPDSYLVEQTPYVLDGAAKRLAPEAARALVDRWVDGIASLPAEVRVPLYAIPVRLRLAEHAPAEAVALAEKALALLDESAYLTRARKLYDAEAAMAKRRYPKEPMRPFDETRARSDYRDLKARLYVGVGKGDAELGKLDEAERAFREAIKQEWAAKDAYVGLARIAERRGRAADALELMTEAQLKGRLDAAEIEYFHTLYKRAHGGSLDGVETYLDARYRKSYTNPVEARRYAPTAARTDRVALAEFFTGAGCVPCLVYDYSFDRALEAFSRRDLALLVYHIHAPTMDPMGNAAADARGEYYGVQGAPTVFLDGSPFEGGEAESTAEARSRAQATYDEVAKGVSARLETAPGARLTLDAKLDGRAVRVTAAADRIAGASGDVMLHVALVEDGISYSGENGQRFWPMVVRALARPDGSTGYGFKVAGSGEAKVEYVFEFDEVAADNLRYYAEYGEQLKKRLPPEVEIDVSFREKRNEIDASKLAVVAFVQDNASKRILQAVYAPVGAGARAETGERARGKQ